jgi:hypothetical protein
MKDIVKNFSEDSIKQIEDQLTIWTVADLEETTDHLGEIVIEVLEEEGVEVPSGYFNEDFNTKVIELAKDLESKKVSLEETIDSIVSILIDPNNYTTDN